MKNVATKTFTNERPKPNVDFGLTIKEVAERKAQGLTNTTPKSYSKSYLSIFVGNICTFFNLLGLIVTIALIIAGANLSKFFFVVIYIVNLLIGIIQEVRAKHCVDKLSLIAQKNVKVIREGKTTEIPSNEIVIDDVICLGIGSQIPTDSKILSGVVEVNESFLTGESVPVKKSVGDTLHAGSFIVAGTCTVIATAVGKDNYVQKLSAKAKQYKKPHSELMSSLQIIISSIGAIIIPIAVLFILKAIGNGSNMSVAIISTSSLIIGMIPSGMFLLTSLALAVGIIKLASNNTLVQDLYSLEMLARVDTICFDKTGTITDGNMTVKDVAVIKETFYTVDEIISSMLGALKDNNQTAIALYNRFGESNALLAQTVLPFNSTRKLSAVSFVGDGTFCFGAPEFVLSKEEYDKISKNIDAYARKGLRVLILAHSPKFIKEDILPTDFSPIAYILIVDNVREDAMETIKWFKENDVAVKVISGDNPITVSEVSKRVGIDNAEKYISLEGLSDEEVAKVANDYTIFGRVSPEQKAILIRAIKSAGHVTAMTGDGVNDILALKEADCAITVASGSDAARNVSHIVLLDNNFSSMPKVVMEGRRVINNVQSSASLFLMKTIFTIILGLITLILPLYRTYPILLDQMVFLEAIVIGLPSFFLSLQPNKDRLQGKFIDQVLQKSLPSALLMLFNFFFFEVSKWIFRVYPSVDYNTMEIYAITLGGVASLYHICQPLNKYRKVLFFTVFTIILGIIIFGVFGGLVSFTLVPLTPFKRYWHHILLIFGLIVLDYFVLRWLNKVLPKLKLPNFLKIKK